MKKYIAAVLSTFILLLAQSVPAKALVVNLSCVPDASATNYQLLQSVAGAPYAAILPMSPTCVFATTIDDTKQTCFQYSAINANGTTTRTWTWVCFDPTKMPPNPATTLGVK